MEPLETKRKKTFWGVFKELTTKLLILVFIGPLSTCYLGVFVVPSRRVKNSACKDSFKNFSIFFIKNDYNLKIGMVFVLIII